METEVLATIRHIKEIVKREDIVINDAIEEFPFQPLIKVLGDILKANTYLIDDKGELLGFLSVFDVIHSARTKEMMLNRQLDPDYMTGLYDLNMTMDNIEVTDPRTIFAVEYQEEFPEGKTAIVPIFVANLKVGYLVIARPESNFSNIDLILAEYIASLLALEMDHLNRDRQAETNRRKHLIELAVKSLSYSELMALRTIFENKEEPVFRITASRIAEEVGITRSVIVNALRKMESAGVIQSRSLGMKGTHIDVNNKRNLDLLKAELYGEF